MWGTYMYMYIPDSLKGSTRGMLRSIIRKFAPTKISHYITVIVKLDRKFNCGIVMQTMNKDSKYEAGLH